MMRSVSTQLQLQFYYIILCCIISTNDGWMARRHNVYGEDSDRLLVIPHTAEGNIVGVGYKGIVKDIEVNIV